MTFRNQTILSAILPCWNEGLQIAKTIEKVKKTLAQFDEIRGQACTELIVVNDGSQDETPEILKEINGIQTFQLPFRAGYGAAVKAGVERSRGNWLLLIDADNSFECDDLEKLWQGAVANQWDLVIGDRWNREEGESGIRQFVNVWLSDITKLREGALSDPLSGFRLIRRSVIETLGPLPQGRHFNAVMTLRSAEKKIRAGTVPVRYRETIGTSRFRFLRDIWTMSQALYSLKYHRSHLPRIDVAAKSEPMHNPRQNSYRR